MFCKDVGTLMSLHNKGYRLLDIYPPITSAHLDLYTAALDSKPNIQVV